MFNSDDEEFLRGMKCSRVCHPGHSHIRNADEEVSPRLDMFEGIMKWDIPPVSTPLLDITVGHCKVQSKSELRVG